MKKKSTSQSAPARRSLGEGGFFNLRVSIGLFVALAGVFLALLGSGAFSNLFAQRPQAGNPQQPLVRAQYRGVMPVVKFDISPPLRSIEPVHGKECTLREDEERGPIPLGPVGRSFGTRWCSGCSARLEYRVPSSVSMAVLTSAVARRQTPTVQSVPITS